LNYWEWLLPILPVIILSLLLNRHGIRLTFDSQHFLCAAQSFAQSGKLTTCNGGPMVLSAIGFPVLLSFFPNIPYAYALLSLLLLWLTMGFWLKSVKETIQEKSKAFLASWGIVFGLPFFFPFLFLWSEGPFLLLLSIGFWALLQFEREESNTSLLILCSTFTLSLSLRFAGIFIVFPTLLALLYSKWSSEKKSPVAFCFLPPLLIVLGMWGRMYVLSRSVFGHREKSHLAVWKVIEQSFSVPSNWLIPSSYIGHGTLLLFFAIVGLSFRWGKKSWMWVCLCYIASIVLSASLSEVEYDERIFAPIYPLFMIAFLQVFEFHKDIPWRRYLSQFLAILWCSYTLIRFVKNVLFWYSG
jgi:hypothetical protein